MQVPEETRGQGEKKGGEEKGQESQETPNLCTSTSRWRQAARTSLSPLLLQEKAAKRSFALPSREEPKDCENYPLSSSASLSTKAQPKGSSKEMDISLFSETEGDEGSGNDPDALLLHLKKQWPNQVSPLSVSSPKQNEYLTGLMKSPQKRQVEAVAKLALDAFGRWVVCSAFRFHST
jgi:hypothetical protein